LIVLIIIIEYLCHVYVRADGLGAVLISDADYPHRVAHTLLTKVLDDISTRADWKTSGPDAFKSYKGL
jgi:synaptobrevin family protein YKT6